MTGTTSQLGRPVGADGEQTRRRIITAAMRCVAEVGYSRATIREIARAADMTSGSLYHYFANKSDLFGATGQEIEQIVLPRLRAAIEQTDDVVDQLDALLDESKRLILDYPYLTAFGRAMRAQSTAQPGSKALREVVTEVVEDARGQGRLSSETDASAAIEAICALARGLSEQAASLPPDAYDATLGSAKKLIRGTLFYRGRRRR
jgi:AcrR family transcriptional regulator